MDIAVKRGFAIGFVVVAGLSALYGCQPEIQNAVQALRGETPPTRLVIPVEPAPKPSPPQAAAPASPQASAPASPPAAAPAPSMQPSVAAPGPSASAAAPTSPSPSEPPAAVTPNAQDQAALTPQTPQTPQTPVAPETPAAPAAAPDASKGGAFDIVRVEPSGEMVVAGRCAANCDAELLANGRPHDAAKADADGQWAMTPKPLPPGDYQLALRTKGADGKEATSQQTLTVAIPKPPSKDVVVVLNDPDAPSKILQQPEPKVAAVPAAPLVPAPPADRPAAAAAPSQPVPGAAAPAAGGATPEPRAMARTAGAALAIGAVEAENGRFYAQGSGPTDAQLRLYLNNAPLASATIGPDERWSLKVERGLAPGAYVVRADQLDPGTSKVIGRAETTFTYSPQMAAAGTNAPPPVAPAETRAAEPAPPPAASADRSAPPSPPADRQAAVAPSPEPAPPPAAMASPDTPAPTVAPSAPPSPDAANPVIASIDTAQVRRGDSLWRISRTTYGRGVRYTEIYQANGSQIRNPNLIYPGQVLVLPADSASATRPARP